MNVTVQYVVLYDEIAKPPLNRHNFIINQTGGQRIFPSPRGGDFCQHTPHPGKSRYNHLSFAFTSRVDSTRFRTNEVTMRASPVTKLMNRTMFWADEAELKRKLRPRRG